MIADVLRWAVFAEASLCLWATATVLRRYRARYHDARSMGTAGRRSSRHRWDSDWIGLLPLHVYLVTAFTLLVVMQTCAVVAGRIGDSLVWWGTPLSLVSLGFLLAALVVIAQYENRVSGRS